MGVAVETKEAEAKDFPILQPSKERELSYSGQEL